MYFSKDDEIKKKENSIPKSDCNVGQTTHPTCGGDAYYACDDAFGRASPPRSFLRGTPSLLSAWLRNHCHCRAGSHRPAVTCLR